MKEPIMSIENLTALDDSSYSDFVKNNDGIIIFHKKLCPHCKIMGTVLEKVSAQLPIALAAVDSEEQAGLMSAAGVERVPTLVVVKGGEIRARFTGIMNPKETIAYYKNA